VALVLALTFLVTSNLNFPFDPPASLVSLGLLGVSEVLVGVAVGLTVSFFVYGVRMAGQIAGLQIGLGFAMLVDPLTGSQTTVLSRLLGLACILVILSFNGHFILIKGLSVSFQHLPPGQAWVSLFRAAQAIPAAAVTLFSTAVLVASPALAAVFCVKICMAIMARAAPQVHILAIGFILTIVVGMFTIAWSVTGMGDFFKAGFEKSAIQALSLLAAS
jgi:flagellar biosynthetic protein FliR